MKSGVSWLALMAALVLVGCGESGPALQEVEGTVTYNGAPLADASVVFVFDDGTQSNGTTGPDGKFTVATGNRVGAPIGKVAVAISKVSSSGTASMTPEDMAKASLAGQPVVSAPALPVKYADPKTSGLTAEIQAGGKDKNKFSFPLVD